MTALPAQPLGGIAVKGLAKLGIKPSAPCLQRVREQDKYVDADPSEVKEATPLRPVHFNAKSAK
jgi:hypothetical protein